MTVNTIRAQNRGELEDFVKFPYRLYKNDRFWVPPIIKEQRDWIINNNTPLFRNNPHAFFIAREENRIVGRIAVAEDLVLKEKRDKDVAYFTMIEGEDNSEVFKALTSAAEEWALSRGLKGLQGPVSPTKGDDFRGTLIWGFDSKPVLMDTYNPKYYNDHIEAQGYRKHLDLYAYFYDLTCIDIDRRMKIVDYAKRKYNFRIDTIDTRNISNVATDIKYVLDRAMPEWPDLVPPEFEEVLSMAQRLKKYADPDIILIARDRNSVPIGFNVALPDYNIILSDLNGRIGLRGTCKFLLNRKNIKTARMFVMFIVPEYRKKGVSYAIYLTGMKNALDKGYLYAEGSTIGEENLPMRRDAEKVGGKHYKTYRTYRKMFN